MEAMNSVADPLPRQTLTSKALKVPGVLLFG